ncbi:MAG: LacI family transcriptional regulator, partial [Lactobacillus iners]|nr:LacI family transcriptional regulator [Lactobacillus iners]
KLTTVKQPIIKLGELLSDMLLQKISQSGAQQGELLIEPTLIKRDTTRN